MPDGPSSPNSGQTLEFLKLDHYLNGDDQRPIFISPEGNVIVRGVNDVEFYAPGVNLDFLSKAFGDHRRGNVRGVLAQGEALEYLASSLEDNELPPGVSSLEDLLSERVIINDPQTSRPITGRVQYTAPNPLLRIELKPGQVAVYIKTKQGGYHLAVYPRELTLINPRNTSLMAKI